MRGREPLILRMTAWAVVANLLLNLSLIPRFGMSGAAVATLATEVLRAGLARVQAARAGFPSSARIARGRRWRGLAACGAMALGLAAALSFGPWVGGGHPELGLQLALGATTYLGVLGATGGIRFKGGCPRLEV